MTPGAREHLLGEGRKPGPGSTGLSGQSPRLGGGRGAGQAAPCPVCLQEWGLAAVCRPESGQGLCGLPVRWGGWWALLVPGGHGHFWLELLGGVWMQCAHVCTRDLCVCRRLSRMPVVGLL